MPDEEKLPLYNAERERSLDELQRCEVMYMEALKESKAIDTKYGKDAMPNLSLPKRISIVAPDFIDEEDMTADQRQLRAKSILAPEVIRAMAPEEVKKQLKAANALKQIFLFALSTAFMGFSSLVETSVLWDPEQQRKVIRHIPATPSLMNYLISSLFCFAFTTAFCKPSSVLQILDPKVFAMNLPIALAYCYGDWAGLQVQKYLNGPMWRVLGQTKLMITACISWILLKRTQTVTQWTILLAISFLIAAYGLRDMKNLEIDSWGIVLAGFASVLLSCIAGVVSEMMFKKIKADFLIQMGQNRISCGVVSTSFAIVQIVKSNRWHDFPFGGWTRWTWMLVAMDIGRSWTACAVVKRLDSIWKSLAMAMSLGVTYVCTAAVFSGPMGIVFEWSQFSLVCAIAASVLAYAGSKREEHKILQLQADVERRLEDGSYKVFHTT